MILNDDILDAIRNKKYALKKVEPPILGIKLVNRVGDIESWSPNISDQITINMIRIFTF